MRCKHWEDGAYCLADGARLYLIGLRCAKHTPAAIAGRAES